MLFEGQCPAALDVGEAFSWTEEHRKRPVIRCLLREGHEGAHDNAKAEVSWGSFRADGSGTRVDDPPGDDDA